jgi:hypothetical protein
MYRKVPELGTGIDPGGRMTAAPAEGPLPNTNATATNTVTSTRHRSRGKTFI